MNQTKIKIKTYIKLDTDIVVDKVWEKVYHSIKDYITELWQEASTNY